MVEISVAAERVIPGPADRVYSYLADYRDHHPHLLPPAFSEYRVEEGGTGAGTVVSFLLTAGRRLRRYRMCVSEPDPGRVLMETDETSSLTTTFTVTPLDQACRVRIATRWQGGSGIGGFFERTFAPRVLRGLYVDELNRLATYTEQQASPASR